MAAKWQTIQNLPFRQPHVVKFKNVTGPDPTQSCCRLQHSQQYYVFLELQQSWNFWFRIAELFVLKRLVSGAPYRFSTGILWASVLGRLLFFTSLLIVLVMWHLHMVSPSLCTTSLSSSLCHHEILRLLLESWQVWQTFYYRWYIII